MYSGNLADWFHNFHELQMKSILGLLLHMEEVKTKKEKDKNLF